MLSESISFGFENCPAPGAIGSRSQANPATKRLKNNLSGRLALCLSPIGGRLALFLCLGTGKVLTKWSMASTSSSYTEAIDHKGSASAFMLILNSVAFFCLPFGLATFGLRGKGSFDLCMSDTEQCT